MDAWDPPEIADADTLVWPDSQPIEPTWWENLRLKLRRWWRRMTGRRPPGRL